MPRRPPDFATTADAIMDRVHDLLASDDPGDHVRAIHHLALGMVALERDVVLDAQASGMTWAEIGEVYAVSRQAVHRRFTEQLFPPGEIARAIEGRRSRG